MSSSSIPPTVLTTTSRSPDPDSTRRGRKPTPVFISVNRADVDPIHLRDLLRSCGLSCHRFPRVGPDGRPEPVDIGKLRTALANSAVVVSAFSRSQVATGDDSGFGFEAIFGRAILVPPAHRRLVGFGRAVSDGGLTASIHDVAVIPSLQRLGIGRKIVQRIIRILSAKDIYDISALCCSEKERLFFKACSFGDDLLESTTMMYMKTASVYPDKDPLATHVGRLVLSVPPPQKVSIFKRPAKDGVNHDMIC